MTLRLEVTVIDNGHEQARTLHITRVFNLSRTLRDVEKMRAHLDEMAAAGIDFPPPARRPRIIPISTWATISSDEVAVQSSSTTGEVEPAIVECGDELLIGVGSDHTDRELEKTSLPWSKQVAPNVVAPVFWKWEDVRAHWDDLVIESFIDGQEPRVPYQHAALAEFWTPEETLAAARERIAPASGDRLFLCGTPPSDGGALKGGRSWTIALRDPVLGRQIEHTYTVVVLDNEVRD